MKKYLASCDRTEASVAVLVRDCDAREITVKPPLSYCLTEGGIYECEEEAGRIVSVFHLTEEEARRREASLSRLAGIYGKK